MSTYPYPGASFWPAFYACTYITVMTEWQMPSKVMEPLVRTLAAAASRRTWCGWLFFGLVSLSTTVYTFPGEPS